MRKSGHLPEHDADQERTELNVGRPLLAISAITFTALVVAILTTAGIGARYLVRGDFNIVHALLTLFFSVNLWICYWEICLFFKRDHVERRADYWRERQRETGRKPAIEFLTSKVPFSKLLSPVVWADVWAAYSEVDASYADRRTYGFNVDIANGFVTPIPMLVLYAAYTFDVVPAFVAGIIGAMLFWQIAYATSVYWVSFFVARRQAGMGLRNICVYILALNSPWVLFSLLGLYVSIRLIVDGDYSAFGH